MKSFKVYYRLGHQDLGIYQAVDDDDARRLAMDDAPWVYMRADLDVEEVTVTDVLAMLDDLRKTVADLERRLDARDEADSGPISG